MIYSPIISEGWNQDLYREGLILNCFPSMLGSNLPQSI